MRAVFLAVVLSVLAPFSSSFAGSLINQQDADARVLASGYSLVSKTDAAPEGWDVWASKDGIAYEVRVDGRSGRMISAKPVDNDD